jgi:phage shock protein PspC (stress-responsive transcriptional regulator)
MQSSRPSPFLRDDTLLGVCASVGEDFGFNPIYLRLTLGVLLIWNPAIVVGGYAAAGALLALSHWAFPDPRSAVPAETEADRAPAAAQEAEREPEPELLIAA